MIAQTLGAAGASVKLVVLNACFTEMVAEALLPHVDCVVGMSGSIHDDAARSFAIGFYGGLGEHESIAGACAHGRAAIRLGGLRDENQPRLRARDGVDATQIVLAAHPVRAAVSRGNALLSFDVDSLDSDLQDVIALAAAQARQEGKTRISTHHVFAAFMRLRPRFRVREGVDAAQLIVVPAPSVGVAATCPQPAAQPRRAANIEYAGKDPHLVALGSRELAKRKQAEGHLHPGRLCRLAPATSLAVSVACVALVAFARPRQQHRDGAAAVAVSSYSPNRLLVI